MNENEYLAANGYVVLPIERLSLLEDFRVNLVRQSKLVFGNNTPEMSPEDYINRLHLFESVATLTEAEFNEGRRRLICDLNATEAIIEKLFSICKDQIIRWLGPDLIIQKNINLTIQKPNDPYPTEIHRDSPPNSPYELAIWIPLTDCMDTKALRLVPLEPTRRISEKIRSYGNCALFEADVKEAAVSVPVRFGQALYFSPTLFHYSVKNEENQTRFSINIRIKNMYTPFGLKHPAAFFTPINTSIISNIGFRATQIDRVANNG